MNNGLGGWHLALLSSAPYINVQDRKASGTDGGTFTSGAWRTRTLNTVVTDTHGIVVLSADQLTFPAGTYYCQIMAPGRAVNSHVARLRNVQTGITVVIGQPARNLEQTNAMIVGRFTLSGPSVLEVQHICETTGTTNGFGISAGSRVTGGVEFEIYTVAEFWKIA
jgi:hypothetical protein